MSFTKFIAVAFFILIITSPLSAEFTKGKVTKVEKNYFIISAGSFRRARRGNLFWARRVVSGRLIKVGLLRVDQVYYDSSRCVFRFSPPLGTVRVNDKVKLARLQKAERFSREYLKDSIASELKQDQWEKLLSSCVYLLLKNNKSAFARFKIAHYFLRYGLYSSAYNNLKAAEKNREQLEPYDRISLDNLLGIIEFRANRKKIAMAHLDKVINFKYLNKRRKKTRKVPQLDVNIFDEEFIEEKKQAISIREKLIEKRIGLNRSVGALLKGFILEKDGYGVFSELILSNVEINRAVLEESAEVMRYFPVLKKEFIRYVQSVIQSKAEG